MFFSSKAEMKTLETTISFTTTNVQSFCNHALLISLLYLDSQYNLLGRIMGGLISIEAQAYMSINLDDFRN
jgi:hypothetical protein